MYLALMYELCKITLRASNGRKHNGTKEIIERNGSAHIRFHLLPRWKFHPNRNYFKFSEAMALMTLLLKMFGFCSIEVVCQNINCLGLNRFQQLTQNRDLLMYHSGITVTTLQTDSNQRKYNFNRFSESCLTKFIDFDIVQVIEYLKRVQNLAENPLHVVLLNNSKDFLRQSELDALQKVQTETSYYVVFVRNQSQNSISLLRLCFVCKDLFETVLHPSSIAHYTRRQGINLRRMEISCPGYPFIYHFLFPPHVCHRLGESFRGEERFCTIRTIARHMNFTPMSTLLGDESSASLKIQSAQFTLLLNSQGPSEKYTWLAGGQIVEPFTFLIVTSSENFNLGSLQDIAKPFDLITWSLMSGSIILLSLFYNLLLFLVELTPSPRAKVFSDIEIFFVLLGTVLEQSPSNFVSKVCTKFGSIRLLFILWLLICLVLSGGFKGVFFSILTKQPTIIVPQNFEELINSDFRMLAADFTPKKGFQEYSMVLDNVLAEYKSSSSNLKKDALYQKLVASTFTVARLTYSKIRAIHELRLQIPKSFTNNGKPYTIPTNFAFVSTPSGVSHFLKVMKDHTTSNRKLLPSTHLEHLLTLRSMFIVSRSFFSQQFTKVFESLVESGITRVWEKYRKVVYGNWDRSLLACFFENPDLIFEVGFDADQDMLYKCWGYLNSAPDTNRAIRDAEKALGQGAEKRDESERMSISSFVLIMTISVYCLAISGIAFGIEVFFDRCVLKVSRVSQFNQV